MNQRQGDILVGGVIATILIFGLISSGQLLVADDPGMGHMEFAPAIHFVGPLFASLVVASVIAVSYAVIRERLFADPQESGGQTPHTNDDPPDQIDRTSDSDRNSAEAAQEPVSELRRHPILDVLPDDEEHILEPIITSPGITQVEVRDRSGYSRSKVSQTVTDLEKRGLVYRERQGRTYRIYPADDLNDRV